LNYKIDLALEIEKIEEEIIELNNKISIIKVGCILILNIVTIYVKIQDDDLCDTSNDQVEDLLINDYNGLITGKSNIKNKVVELFQGNRITWIAIILCVLSWSVTLYLVFGAQVVN